ncbi:ATP-binding protein [Solirubrobacter ginsenosidimutans]|uniref:ATP-binding protein n=1 Tax=Solirubrobacter ginsenosidimutans TaxID=490573 RepID=A0A9X3S8B0_9ACTN|nr:ATP-binding protein [Solirubrobacter ginsenosidimutans]MDA0166816.1 ATP-binding protein [Solirubrobacter ginsenosidimutans]
MDAQQWQAKAELSSVPTLPHAVSEFARTLGFQARTLDDLRTCVSEATTNAVVHAFRDGRKPGTIVVCAQASDNELVIRVSDDGTGFAPRTDSPGLGLGIPTIAAMATTMSIGVATTGGTEISMTFPRGIAVT